MNILEKHQVVCTIKLWYQKHVWTILRYAWCIGDIASVIGIYIYINVNIFVNTQSILKIIASKRF